jgi:hypothetical protein
MASIDIKLTQAAYDRATQPTGLFDNLTAMLADAAAGVQDDSDDASGYSIDSGSFRLNFPDGSYDEFTGFNVMGANNRKGSAMATGARLFIPNEGESTQQGVYNFNFDVTGPVPTATRVSSLTTSITVKSLFQPGSEYYDAVMGNGSLRMAGAISVNATGNLSGNVFDVEFTADKVLTRASFEGVFQLSGDVRSIAEGSSKLGVAGTMTGADIAYADGSFVKASGVSGTIDGFALGGPLALATSTALAGNDTIRVELPATLRQAYTVKAGEGNDVVTLGGGQLHVDAGAGRDTINVVSDNHRIDGGAGFDTVVYQEARSAVTITRTAFGFDVGRAGGVDQVSNVERLHFGRDAVAFDVNGAAGQAYRVYQAAFDRAPDKAGLGFWISSIENNVSLVAVAAGFIASKEFTELYGVNPSNEVFVTRLYANVLHRPYEQAGFDFWMNALDKGVARAEVLASFSESTENQLQVIGTIQNGMEFTLQGG